LTGAHAKRRALARCLRALQAGDTLIVRKLDRLGRSLCDLMAMMAEVLEYPVASLLSRNLDPDVQS
jgi:DNA invertase Pin-like site-specific DNA recombinase